MEDIRARIKEDGPESVIIEIFKEGNIGYILIAIAVILVCGVFWLLYKALTTRKGRIILLVLIGASFLTSLLTTLFIVLFYKEPYVDPLEYTLSENGEYYSVSGIASLENDTLEIPATIDGKPVKHISDSAFKKCNKLKNVIISEGITSIGASAFEDCDSLTSITIPNSVTSIGDAAFNSCESLISIVIPNSVTTMGSGIFEWCDSLQSATLPNSITSIPNHMFYCCKSLQTVNIPSGVTSIDRCAFFSCDSLTSITIPQSVSKIDELAFAYNAALTTITYLGTESQWSAIEKVEGYSSSHGILNWDSSTYNYTVYCTDCIILK